MGNRPHSRRTLGGQRKTIHLRWFTLFSVLLFTSAIYALGQASPPPSATVELRIQLDWSAPSSAHPANIVVAPVDHRGDAQALRLSLTSDITVKVPPGRYQLTTTTPLVINHQAYGWNVELALFDPVNTVRLSQENAVRLAKGDVIEPASAHMASAAATTTDAPAGINARSQIIAVLNRWVASFRAHELSKQMSCYAPQLARYLQQRNVSSYQVQAEKRRTLQLYTNVRRYDLSDINLALDGGQAAVTAVKTWELTNHEVESRGNAEVHFEFAQVGGRWLITSEWESPMAERLKSAAVR
jgi:hypothetical protein